jgi:hypothetical protein
VLEAVFVEGAAVRPDHVSVSGGTVIVPGNPV